MKRKTPNTKDATKLGKPLTSGKTRIPRKLSAGLQAQASESGESIFARALRTASADHLARVERITGPLDIGFCLHVYQCTQNPIWLWIGLAETRSPGEIRPEIFRYLKQIADAFLQGVVDQVQALEHVRITPGREVQEGMEAVRQTSPPSPEIATVLGLSVPGRNLFQAAARDLRKIATEVAIQDRTSRTGRTQEETHAELAIVLGRTSPDTGPSTEVIRKLASGGRKLIRKRMAKPPG